MGEFIQKIKKVLLKFYVGKVVMERTLLPYDSSVNIGIVYRLEYQREQLINGLKHDLESAGKEVYTFGLSKEKGLKGRMFPNRKAHFIDKEGLNWMGFPKKDQISDFCDLSLDYLIVLDDDPQDLLFTVAGLSKAKFRIARHQEDYLDYVDLMIKCDDNENSMSYYDEVFKQLKKNG